MLLKAELPWYFQSLLAALGFVGGYLAKVVSDQLLTSSKARKGFYSRLEGGLYPLLEVTSSTFKKQKAKRKRLLDNLKSMQPELFARYRPNGIEAVFEAAYLQKKMSEEDLLIHQEIRDWTIVVFKPVNNAMLDWIKHSRELNSMSWLRKDERALIKKLALLESHLNIWLGKYDEWIPEKPEHALVYLGDTLKHGVPFPTGLDDLVRKYLGIADENDIEDE